VSAPASTAGPRGVDTGGVAPCAPPGTLRVALLGCGNVGSALVGAADPALGIEVVSALVRDTARPRPLPASRLRTRIEDVLADRPDVVVECLGGIEEPAAMCERALAAGIDVVTANKSMLAHALPALAAAAGRSGALLHADASVCAGVPVLDAVGRLRWARIRSISGIVNGTCNFILDSLARAGTTFDGAVAEAVRLGYAEPDPSADLSGRDAAEKACLLAAAAGFGAVRPQDVAVQGLVGPDGGPGAADVFAVRALGQAVRCVARIERTPAGVSLRVAPTVVNGAGPLASAVGTENVVTVETELAGTVTLRGPGAGANPTVAALLADIVACRERRTGWATTVPLAPAQVAPASGGNRIVACIDGWTGSPGELLACVGGAGIEPRGCAFRRGSCVVDLGGHPEALVAAVARLRAAGARVRTFAAEPEVGLRF
jgi:homoserine dehydrogenase